MSLLRRALSLLLTLLWLIGAAEALARFTGGWRFDHLALLPRTRPAPSVQDSGMQASARAWLAAATFTHGVDPAWYQLAPAPLSKLKNPRLARRAADNPAGMGQENYIWNDALFGPQPDQHVLELLQTLKEKQVFAFHSLDGGTLPRYRLYPDNDFAPTPWITNHYGWLSADVTVAKPPNTIRIGIIGDSTSHNFYARQLQSYLDAWAVATHLGVRFEVLNGARQGLEQKDELAVLKYEMAPMGLDYIYAYFAPSFAVSGAISSLVAMPRGMRFGVPPGPRWWSAAAAWFAPLSGMSALLAQLADPHAASAGGLLAEPAKPRAQLAIPAAEAGRTTALTRRDAAARLDHFSKPHAPHRPRPRSRNGAARQRRPVRRKPRIRRADPAA